MHVTEAKREDVAQPVQLSRLDRFAEVVSPSWFASRLAGKQEAGARRAMLSYAGGSGYDATHPSLDRPFTWGVLRSEEAELPGFDRYQLQIEAENLYRNFPIIRAMVDGVARRIGIAHPHFQTSNPKWNAQAEEQWHEWCGDCDVRGRLTFEDMQELVPKSCYNKGDIGLRLIDADGDLKLHVIEGDLIGPEMRAGINIDDTNPLGGIIWDRKTGRIISYLVGRRGVGGLLLDVEPIPANEFLLLWKLGDRADQMRGVPLLAPVIDAAKDLKKYLDATRIQANIAATFGVVIKRNAAAQYASNATQRAQSGAYRTQKLTTGQMTWLHPDEDIQSFEPRVPGPQFDPYAKFCVRMIAIGGGTTYEMLMSDYTGMSYSSSKTNLMTENSLQTAWHRWKVKNMLQPVYNIWVAKRMDSKFLPFNAEAYSGATWPAPAKVGIDANEDSDTDIKLIGAGLESFADYFKRHYGDANWLKRLEQRAIEAKHIKELAEEFEVDPLQISSLLPPGVAPVKASITKPEGAPAPVKPEPEPAAVAADDED